MCRRLERGWLGSIELLETLQQREHTDTCDHQGAEPNRHLRRETFGKRLADLGANHDIIAEYRSEIEMARLLCLKAAWMMDRGDAKGAAPWISQIKAVAPNVALKVTDHAVQMFGGAGISQATPLARMWTHLSTLRLADGPDAVHRRQVARAELAKHTQEKV